MLLLLLVFFDAVALLSTAYSDAVEQYRRRLRCGHRRHLRRRHNQDLQQQQE